MMNFTVKELQIRRRLPSQDFPIIPICGTKSSASSNRKVHSVLESSIDERIAGELE